MFESIFDRLNFFSQSNGDSKCTLYSDPKTKEVHTLSFSEMETRINQLAFRLLAEDKMDSVVLILAHQNLDLLLVFLACIKCRMVPVLVNPGYLKRSSDIFLAMHTQIKSDLILVHKQYLLHFEKLRDHHDAFNSPRVLVINDLITNARNENCTFHLPELKDQDIAYIQYSSGSTRTPKGVIISHENLMLNCQMIQESLKITPADFLVSWLPPYHDMGLVGGIFLALYSGIPGYFFSAEEFLRKPLNWIRYLNHFKATISGGPNFAYELCCRAAAENKLESLDLSNWRIAFSGAEPVLKSTYWKFFRTFKNHGLQPEAFLPCYGLAEATLFVAGSNVETVPEFISVKKDLLNESDWENMIQLDGQIPAYDDITDSMEIIIADINNKVCPHGQAGNIWLKSKSVSRGYYNNPEETKLVFNQYLDDGSGPFLNTGDIGVYQDNKLFLLGRSKDVLIIRGCNYSSADIEYQLENSNSKIIPNGIVVLQMGEDNSHMVILAEVDRHSTQAALSEIIKCIGQTLSRIYSLDCRKIILLKPYSLLKTTSGKKRRAACAVDYRKKLLDSRIMEVWSNNIKHVSLNETLVADERIEIHSLLGIKNTIRNEIAMYLNLNPNSISFSDSFSIFGINSVTAIQIVQRLERKLAVKIPSYYLYKHPTIQGFATSIYQYILNYEDKNWNCNEYS